MKLKSLLCVGVLMTPTLFSVPVNATPEDHRYLAETIQSLGVPLTLNSKVHCLKGESGSYFSAGFMIICQDHRKDDGKQVSWTENDLDTLRHEAHHMIQDCAKGTIGDRKMSLMFDNEKEFTRFISNSGYTQQQLQQIIKHYQKQGVTGYDLLIELEAFAVARSIPANLIADKLKEYCQ